MSQSKEITAHKEVATHGYMAESGISRHSRKCIYSEPQIEGQGSFYEGGEQHSSEALLGKRSQARRQAGTGSMWVPGAEGRGYG